MQNQYSVTDQDGNCQWNRIIFTDPIPVPAGNDTMEDHATTSAALKLLRRRLMGRSPGRSDFVPGTTTADALFVIQSDA